MERFSRLKELMSTDNLQFYLCYLFFPMLLGGIFGAAITYLIIKYIVRG